MKTYLVIFEAPCVGVDERLIHVSCDKEACEFAWRTSCSVSVYVTGSYDIYRIDYDNKTHNHTLTRVDEGELWDEWNGEE